MNLFTRNLFKRNKKEEREENILANTIHVESIPYAKSGSTFLGHIKKHRVFAENVFDPGLVPSYIKEVKGVRGADGIMRYMYTDNYGKEKDTLFNEQAAMEFFTKDDIEYGRDHHGVSTAPAYFLHNVNKAALKRQVDAFAK